MTANEFRNQKISNTRLAWLVYGHKVKVNELKNFSKEELQNIKHCEDRPRYIKELKKLLG